MAAFLASLSHAADVVVQAVGMDVLASLAGLAVIVLFLYIEGGHRSRPSH